MSETDLQSRDLEILRLYKQGMSARAIARQTGISHTTIANRLGVLKVELLHSANRPRLGVRKKLNLTDEEIAARYKAGETITSLCEETGATSQTIRRRLIDQNVDFRNAPYVYGKRTKLPEEEVAQRFEEGETLSALSRYYNVAPGTIKSALDRRGINWRVERKANNKKLPVEELKNRYESGETLEELAAVFEVSATTVWRNLNDAGVTFRTVARVGDNFSEKQLHEIEEAYLKGASEREIARTYDVTRSVIQRLLEQRGVSRRRTHRINLPIDELVERNAAGETAAALAREFGVSPTSIKRRLAEHRDKK